MDQLRKNIYLVLFLTSFLCSAQTLDSTANELIQQPVRVEFEKGIKDIQFTTINGGDQGLMVVKQTNNANDIGFEWVIWQLDTALQVRWEHHFHVPFAYKYRGWDYSEGHYYLLFTTSMFGNDSYSIYLLNTERQDVREYGFSTVFPISLTHFEVVQGTIVMAGQTNANPSVLTFELDDPKPRVVPGIYKNKSTLLDLYVDDEQGRFSVAIQERLIDKRYTVEVKTYTLDNRELYSNTVIPLAKRSILDGAPTQFGAGYQYVAGGYSQKSTQYSEGLYLSRFVGGQQEYISYYNYSQLENFFDYLKPRKGRKVKSKIERNSKQGKRSKFTYRLFMHDIIEQNDQFILVGEAYYPGYESYMVHDSNLGGRVMQATVPGFKYSHAVVVAFDRNGQMIWDLSFSLEDIFKPYLGENVVVHSMKDQIALHYVEENQIRSKIVHSKAMNEMELVTPIMLSNDDEEIGVEQTVEEGIEAWYENKMYAYGEQEIVKTDPGFIRKKRDVYYINKVIYAAEGHDR
jgi:hypothetical protein